MYIDRERKIVILFPTKTGTRTLVKMIKSSDVSMHLDEQYMHAQYEFFPLRKLREEDSSYKFLSFYRDPYDRCVSALYHMRDKMITNLDDFLELRANSGKRLYKRTEMSISDMLDIFDELYHFKWFASIVLPQSKWINNNVILFDFADFENEAKRMMDMIGVENYEVYHENKNYHEVQLSGEEISRIREICRTYYYEDYKLFDSMGIEFDK